jgi:GNAT superfamily N-acetyltransferase
MPFSDAFLPDGYNDVPPGKIVTVVTFLEMRQPPALSPSPAPEPRLDRLRGADVGRYLDIYRRLGERWLWASRLEMRPEALATLLDDPGIQAHAVVVDGQDVGLMEFDLRVPGETELVFFGLDEPAVGAGLGRTLMNTTIRMAFSAPISRFWLHTCHFDHPGALAFYRRSGFTPYKQAIEVADDPRLTGVLPPDSVPQVPVFRP